MPNSANRNAGDNNGSVGQPKHDNVHEENDKPNPERSDIKYGGHEQDHHGDTGRSSSQGRKEASGGEVE